MTPATYSKKERQEIVDAMEEFFPKFIPQFCIVAH